MHSGPLADLYSEALLNHATSPRNRGALPGCTATAIGENPTCGDRVCLRMRINADGIVEDARWEGEGCAISKAAASLVTTLIRGKPAADALRIARAASRAIAEGDMDALRALGGEVACLAGVARFPGRVKCATMAWHAAAEALGDGQGTPVES